MELLATTWDNRAAIPGVVADELLSVLQTWVPDVVGASDAEVGTHLATVLFSDLVTVLGQSPA